MSSKSAGSPTNSAGSTEKQKKKTPSKKETASIPLRGPTAPALSVTAKKSLKTKHANDRRSIKTIRTKPVLNPFLPAAKRQAFLRERELMAARLGMVRARDPVKVADSLASFYEKEHALFRFVQSLERPVQNTETIDDLSSRLEGVVLDTTLTKILRDWIEKIFLGKNSKTVSMEKILFTDPMKVGELFIKEVVQNTRKTRRSIDANLTRVEAMRHTMHQWEALLPYFDPSITTEKDILATKQMAIRVANVEKPLFDPTPLQKKLQTWEATKKPSPKKGSPPTKKRRSTRAAAMEIEKTPSPAGSSVENPIDLSPNAVSPNAVSPNTRSLLEVQGMSGSETLADIRRFLEMVQIVEADMNQLLIDTMAESASTGEINETTFSLYRKRGMQRFYRLLKNTLLSNLVLLDTMSHTLNQQKQDIGEGRSTRAAAPSSGKMTVDRKSRKRTMMDTTSK